MESLVRMRRDEWSWDDQNDDGETKIVLEFTETGLNYLTQQS